MNMFICRERMERKNKAIAMEQNSNAVWSETEKQMLKMVQMRVEEFQKHILKTQQHAS